MQKVKANKFERDLNPSPIRLTQRDEQIIQAIYAYGGFLAARQIYDLFFAGKARRVMERRISLLFHNGYLEWPRLEHRRTKPIAEPIYFLGWRGILLVASLRGVKIDAPISATENQKKLFKIKLKNNGVYWLREPLWHQIPHDIKTIDIRLAFEGGVNRLKDLVIEDWIFEGAFRSEKDRVEIAGKSKKRIVIPDLYLLVVDINKREQGETDHNARLLFEIDMGNHDNPSFDKEKLVAYSAYIGSKAFRARFHSDSGKWLIATTGERRMKHLMKITQNSNNIIANHFLFSIHNRVLKGNPLARNIWWQASGTEPMSLFEEPKIDAKSKMVYRASA